MNDAAALRLQKMVMGIVNGVERWVFKSGKQHLGDQTPYEVIYQQGLLSVRHYHPLTEDEAIFGEEKISVLRRVHRVPLVLIPPLAVQALIFDLFPERSLVRYFLAKGFDVYLIDFGNPDKDHSHLRLEDYVKNWLPQALQSIRQESGKQELSLFGYCMGGLFALMYTALFHDQAIRNIVTVASPVDMHQMGAAGKVLSLTYRPAHKLAKWFNFNLMDIKPEYLHIPGKLGTIGFHLTNPLGSLSRYWDLLLNLWDREYLAVHDSMGQWVNNMLDYPGATMQTLIVQMGFGNQLARGKLKIGDQVTQLERIRCSLLSFAGEDDKIVPVRAAHKIMAVVSSADKEFCVVPGGHAGVFAGKTAPEHLWVMSADWLALRSN